MDEKRPIKVYISTTTRNLTNERLMLADLVSGLGLHPLIYERFSASSDLNVFELCRQTIQTANIFIGVYAEYYGWIAEKGMYGPGSTDGERSFVHYEYDWAAERGIPMLIFFAAPYEEDGKPVIWPDGHYETEPDRIRKLHDFKHDIRKVQTVVEYSSLENLRQLAGANLVRNVYRKLFGGRGDEIIFISHSSKDDGFVDQVAAKLKQAGLQPWVDHQHILSGADWDTALESALDAANSMIVVLTPDANKSLVVKAEWSYFGELGKKIHPILLKKARIPFRLRVLQHTDFEHDPDKAFAQLLEAYGVDPDAVKWTDG